MTIRRRQSAGVELTRREHQVLARMERDLRRTARLDSRACPPSAAAALRSRVVVVLVTGLTLVVAGAVAMLPAAVLVGGAACLGALGIAARGGQ